MGSHIDKRRKLAASVTRVRVFDVICAGAGAFAGSFFTPPQTGVICGFTLAIAARYAFQGRRWQSDADRLLNEGERSAGHRDGAGDLSDTGLLERLPIPYLVLDSESLVQFCSADARLLLARDPVGQHISTIFRAPSILHAVTNALRFGRNDSFEFTALRPLERQLHASVRAINDKADARKSRVVIALQDITRLRQVDAMRIDFVANASHELRTPLTAISGMVETLQGPAREDTANHDRFLDIIARETGRMARLIDDLLSLSRIELEANIAPTEPVDLIAIVTESVNAMTGIAAENGNQITLDMGEGQGIVAGARDEIMQVFHNLISNAIKYGDAGKPITITRHDRAGRIGISVRDRGEGIEAEQIPRLTERFYRISKASSVAKGGTGLGLAIVKHIMSRHRGSLEIVSTIGRGSTFTVWFPASPSK